ncbi:MAG: 23S rRNA (uracil(1939)-C(5))-methyltransferase RlmD [Clostridiales bacterium]|nr:23S rRNA (uracil(1939)-C(5))-methyltransferase RlmD [Clostridiales bacterium]
MPLKKNDVIELNIESCSLSGSGIGHACDGMAVFVPASAVGDVLSVHILKVKSNYAFGKIEEIIAPSPDREENTCPVFPKCGGCLFRHITYDAELRLKEAQVRENLKRIGHVEIQPDSIIPSKKIDGYRNKAQYPVSLENGTLKIGFFAPRSHRVIDCRSCLLQPESFKVILKVVKKWIIKNNITVFDEKTGEGLLRHIYIRKAERTGEISVSLIINGERINGGDSLVSELLRKVPEIKSVTVNVNREKTNVILGEKLYPIYGGKYITDVLCGLKVRLSPLSFYQVNTDQAETLYNKAAEYAALSGNETVVDLYCGAGTIGLSMAKNAKEIIGVEIVPDAVADAEANAALNGITNARFICADAASAAETLKKEGVAPDVVIVDPPRKGCAPELLKTVADMSPEKFIYISCDSATLARDCDIMRGYGYYPTKIAPVDMFPRTGHVETVCLMSRVEGK